MDMLAEFHVVVLSLSRQCRNIIAPYENTPASFRSLHISLPINCFSSRHCTVSALTAPLRNVSKERQEVKYLCVLYVMRACGGLVTHSWTLRGMELSGQVHAATTLPLEKEPPEPIEQEVGWAPQPALTIWIRKKSLLLTANRTGRLSHLIDCAIRAEP
jgi:hypothetical protein